MDFSRLHHNLSVVFLILDTGLLNREPLPSYETEIDVYVRFLGRCLSHSSK